VQSQARMPAVSPPARSEPDRGYASGCGGGWFAAVVTSRRMVAIAINSGPIKANVTCLIENFTLPSPRETTGKAVGSNPGSTILSTSPSVCGEVN
jgi:hypothetical protein